MKKITPLTIALSILALPSFAAPSYDVDSFISIRGDGLLYANKNMQSVVTVNYRNLIEGDRITDVNLFELYTQKPLSEIGLTASFNENEYAHEVSNKSLTEVVEGDKEPYYRRIGGTNGEIEFFVSADKATTRDICFEIRTEKGGYRNSCDKDEYIGTIKIKAINPVIYSGGDMEVRAINTVSDSGPMIISAYGIYNKTNPNLRYLHYSGAIEKPDQLTVNTDAFSLRDSNMNCVFWEGGCVNFTGGYITTPEVNKLSYIESNEPNRPGIFDFAPVDEPFIKVVQFFNMGTLLAGDYTCKAGPNAPRYKCAKYTNAGTGMQFYPETTINPFLSSVQTKNVTVTDIYGTSHVFQFRTSAQGNGGISLDGLPSSRGFGVSPASSDAL